MMSLTNYIRSCLCVLLLATTCISSTAFAETKYVLVQSELNVRAKPSLGSHIYGRLFTGDSVNVTRTYRDWCYLEGLPSEEGHGWISSKYIVNDPVTQMYETSAIIHANGRVAIRDSVNGKRISWVNPGDVVYVYGTSESWTVTDRGYVKTKYLIFQEVVE